MIADVVIFKTNLENRIKGPSDYKSESDDDVVDNILQKNVTMQPVQTSQSKENTTN